MSVIILHVGKTYVFLNKKEQKKTHSHSCVRAQVINNVACQLPSGCSSRTSLLFMREQRAKIYCVGGGTRAKDEIGLFWIKRARKHMDYFYFNDFANDSPHLSILKELYAKLSPCGTSEKYKIISNERTAHYGSIEACN